VDFEAVTCEVKKLELVLMIIADKFDKLAKLTQGVLVVELGEMLADPLY